MVRGGYGDGCREKRRRPSLRLRPGEGRRGRRRGPPGVLSGGGVQDVSVRVEVDGVVAGQTPTLPGHPPT